MIMSTASAGLDTPSDGHVAIDGTAIAVRHSPDRDDPGLPDRHLTALPVGALTVA
jgi:hypothetical protein